MQLRRSDIDLQRRMRKQEAKALGPTLGEFYSQFQGLPGLRGLWYPGVLGETGSMVDASGSARTLTYNGNPTMNLHNNLVPYMSYDGTGDSHRRASEAGLQITGLETYIAASLRGLTVGAIYRRRAAPTSGDGIIGKYLTTGNQRQYALYMTTVNVFQISLDGTLANSASALLPDTGVLDQWYFLQGRFTPGAELQLRRDDEVALQTTAVPASCFATGTDAFWLARGITAAADAQIDIAAGWLAAAAWPDELGDYLFNRSRVLFGI